MLQEFNLPDDGEPLADADYDEEADYSEEE